MRTLAAVLLCSFLTAGTAPGPLSPGGVINAERTSASMMGTDGAAVPDLLPARDPSLVDDSSGTTPGQVVVVTSPATLPAALPPVVMSTLASDGIPVVALRAYRHAADLTNQRAVSCAIPWTLLAAIGRVESDHGRFAASVLLANGLSTPRIIGIPLNGIGTGLVLDTDHGVLDGDPVFDRAVGPMQFIPSTWAIYATDGNGDGVTDPFNIYDAAAAAGRYLCNAGNDLRTTAGKVRAVLTYNHSDSYVASVLALEATYAGTPITTEPASSTPVLSAPLPPVNPGVPTAIYPKVARPASPAPTSTSPSKLAPAPTTSSVKPAPTDTTTTPTPTDTTPAPTDTTTTPATTTPAPTGTTPASTTPAPTDTTPATTTPAPTTTNPSSGTLTDAQKTTLAAMAEEEKLVHDLSLAFAGTYGTPVFSLIANDETSSLTETRVLLNLYAIPDPTASRPPGTFATAATQQLYDTLLAQGANSVGDASAAARTVESTEVTDIKAATTALTEPDVLQLYAKLLDGAQSHLAALG